MPGSAVTTGTTITSSWGNSMPRGLLAWAAVTANQTTITTAVDVTGATVTLTLPASRLIKISAHGWFFSSVANDIARLRIQESTTVLALGSTGALSTTASAGTTVDPFVILSGPSAASHTYKLVAERILGTGNITLQASTTSPVLITVEDLGAV